MTHAWGFLRLDVNRAACAGDREPVNDIRNVRSNIRKHEHFRIRYKIQKGHKANTHNVYLKKS